MYIKSLSLIDYLDLNNKVVSFNKAASLYKSENSNFLNSFVDQVDRMTEILPSSDQKKFVLSKDKDVLNENVLFSEVEYELRKDSKKHF